jgi:hypothetical protein
MKNSDMPAMPVTADGGEVLSGKCMENGPLTYQRDCIGLTKREHFAGLAMQGFLTCVSHSPKDHIAAEAVAMADALLEELEK